MGDFAKCYAIERKEEGGNDDDKRDPGGRTSRGILQREFDAWCDTHGRPRGDVWKASEADIEAIYRENYWIRIHGDDLPVGLDLCLMDSAVNSGVSQTAKWVQRALGIKVDGDFGPQTFAALAADRDNAALIASILDKRLTMDKGLKTWAIYGDDWSARIARVKQTATSWVNDGVAEAAHPNVTFSTPRARPEDLKPVPVSRQMPQTLTVLGTLGATMAGTLHTVSGPAQQAADALRPIADIWPPIATVCAVLAAAGAVAGILFEVWHQRHQALVDGSAGG